MHALLLAPLLLAAPLPSSAAPPRALESCLAEDGLGTFRSRVVQELEALCEECHEKKAYRVRDRLYEGLLHYAPDHPRARKVLGYRRGKEGEWERGKYREPKNYDRDEVEALEHRIDEVVRALVRDLTGLLERGAVPTPERRGHLESLLPLSPDNVALREALGEARYDGRWLRSEAVRGLERRESLRARARAAFADGPEGDPWELPPGVAATGLEFTAHRETDRVRVAGTGKVEEILRATKVLHELQDLLRTEFDVKVNEPKLHRGRLVQDRSQLEIQHFAYYFMDTPERRARFIAGYPGLSANDRELFPQMASAWLDRKGTMGVWIDTVAERLDTAVRQRIGAFLRDHFQISTKSGWIWEGYGMLLTERFLGTRLTFFVRPSKYVEGGGTVNLSNRMRDPASDWYALALERLQTSPPPRIPFVLGRDVNQLTGEDLLLSYALAGFLIEGHPEHARNVLQRVGAGEDPVRVLESEFRRPLTETVAALATWLSEVTPEAGGPLAEK